MKNRKTQFTIILPNTPGALAVLSERLAKKGVNILAISGEGAKEHGIVRIITDDIKSTENALKGRYKFIKEDTLIIKLKHRPGELAKMTKKIANAGININFIYVFNTTKDSMELAISTDDLKATEKVLRV